MDVKQMIFLNKSDKEFKRKCKTVSTDLQYLQIVVTCNVFVQFVSFFRFLGVSYGCSCNLVDFSWFLRVFGCFVISFPFRPRGCGDDIYMLR